MASGRVSQLHVRSLDEGADARTSQLAVRTVFNYPAEAARFSQMVVRSFDVPSPMLRVAQVFVRVLIKGRVDDPRVRAWTFTLDGHDFYVLHLGTIETLVYDTHSGEWYSWGSGTDPLWRAYTGCNWIGGRKFGLNWSNVICGDDGNGALYFLSPDDDYDDDSIVGADTPRPFTRMATGQLVVKPGYASVPCFGVQLFGSIGSNASDDVTVNLQVSDDRGFTYTDCGDIALDAADYNARVNWLSLGSMVAPGRLFKITDTGALKRIDGLEADG
jgi:hypothetical protein